MDPSNMFNLATCMNYAAKLDGTSHEEDQFTKPLGSYFANAATPKRTLAMMPTFMNT